MFAEGRCGFMNHVSVIDISAHIDVFGIEKHRMMAGREEPNYGCG
jgi:hypothetical protein